MKLLNGLAASLSALLGPQTARATAADAAKPPGAAARHRHATEAMSDFGRDYGPNDPVTSAPGLIWPCPCGGTPVMRFELHDEASREPYHFVQCVLCDREGRPALLPWEAVAEWDRAYPNLKVTMGSFPFFMIGELSPRDARTRLLSIRHDLERRRAETKLRSREGVVVGKRYRERIDAYLRWTIVAQSLATAHLRLQQRELAEGAVAFRGAKAPNLVPSLGQPECSA
ncbi:exported hypothetical protein [Rubrivivax sp. A210]|uniref:hypothetical protein n=1 Tax=Rubrivivax sp. A210 TaxID=2772301 RepID=UPI001918BFA5|nr:hypothetical protein [Rubrivivax sp. A210]CAD5366570.1 exported hypothetical protein [Rubrivivax sp. A210]